MSGGLRVLDGRRRARGPVSVRRALAEFALSGLVAVVALAALGFLLLREAGTREAIRDAKNVGVLAGHGIVERQLTPAFWRGEPAARAEMNRVIDRYVLTSGVVRVKVWDPDGTIVYSDEARLVGEQFNLGEDERNALRSGETEAELSDLSRPENRFERVHGELLEVYLPIETPGGRTLLFETYKRFSSVTDSGSQIWRSFAVPLLLVVVLLSLTQVPLAWSMARRLREGQRQREALLHRTLTASENERRRIAGSLHDGVVQDLTGISYSLSAAAQRLPAGADGPAASLEQAAQRTRQTIRRLRSALVDIYPPDLRRSGFAAALADLVAAAEAEGVKARVELPAGLELDADAELILFRVAQEALANVTKHAGAEHVEVRVERSFGRAVLTVCDDGRGFEDVPPRSRDLKSHFGLVMLHDLVDDAGGKLLVEGAPGDGSCVRVEIAAD